MCSSTNSRSASVRDDAPSSLQLVSPNEVTPTTVGRSSIVMNAGPPESPEHVPRLSACEKQSRLVLDSPKLAQVTDVRSSSAYCTPPDAPGNVDVLPKPTSVTVTPTGAFAASRLMRAGAKSVIGAASRMSPMSSAPSSR